MLVVAAAAAVEAWARVYTVDMNGFWCEAVDVASVELCYQSS